MIKFAKIFTLMLVLVTGAYVFLVQPKHEAQHVAIGGAFSLTDQNGKTVTAESLKGKPSLVYFGFTFCPDICPTGLVTLQKLAAKMGDVAPQRVFISIDPERDTVAVMKEFAANFEGLIALTGSAEAVKQAALAYKVYYQKASDAAHPTEQGDAAQAVGSGERSPANKDYMIDHSSYIYLMDADGKYLAHYPHTISVDDLEKGIKEHL